jgi:putative hydrolase of the HAD superfamily
MSKRYAAGSPVDWRRIDTVMLDMDGTLLDLHFDNFFWQTHLPHRYAALHGLPEAEAMSYLQARFAEQHGKLHWYCLDYWRDTLQVDIVALKKEVSHLIQMRPHSAIFLDALIAAGKSVWLVTNAHADSIRLKMTQAPLAPWMDRIVSSHDIGAAKESELFWQALQQRHPFNAANTLFVDDTVSVLEAARTYGIQHLLCILQPDSKMPPRTITAFPAVIDFDEVLPVL